MQWTYQQKLQFGFWLLALIPALLGIVAYRNAYLAADAAGDVARTNEIVKSLEQFLSELKDIEVAQREFVLTGDESHVAIIERSHTRFQAGLQQLRGLRAERRWMELLDSLIPQKLDEVRKTVELRRSQGIEAAARHLQQGRDDKAMDDIRRVVSNMVTEENRQLFERTAAERKSFLTTMFVFGFVLLLDIALIWLIGFRVRAFNQELERRVALRTEALQRSNEDLQQFAYVASHDLKEPLRMISSYCTLLQRRYQGRLDTNADTYLGFITDGVRRMNTFISDLLEYSRAGEVPEENLGPVDTDTVIKNVLSNLKVTVAESRATITFGSLPHVTYDPLRLTQIFQNLIGNAVKYRGERRPEIVISSGTDETETVFSVKDNGIGIDPKDACEIFGIFKRLHGKQYEGSGIGLAMVKKIVERQGGRIWVESLPGVGSTFHFSVPHSQHVIAESTTA